MEAHFLFDLDSPFLLPTTKLSGSAYVYVIWANSCHFGTWHLYAQFAHKTPSYEYVGVSSRSRGLNFGLSLLHSS